MASVAAAISAASEKMCIRDSYTTLLIVMMLYCGLAFVVLHYVDMHQLTSNPNVAVATAARELLGTAGFGLIYLTIFIAYATGINATSVSYTHLARRPFI